MDYPPTQAFRCKFSGALAETAEQSLNADIGYASQMIGSLGAEQLYKQIQALLKDDAAYNDYHRAIIFLSEVVKRRADEIAARLDKGGVM